MRPFIVAVVGLAATAPNNVSGYASETAAKKSPVVKSRHATAETSHRGFGPWEVNQGYVVAVDERSNSFDLRASDGLIQAKNPESIRIMDRYGNPLTAMTLSKLRDGHYYVTVRTEGSNSAGTFKFFFNVEALP